YLRQREHIALEDVETILRVLEHDRHDPEVHEVLSMDAREALGEHGSKSEIARGERCVLPARALTVVAPAHDDPTGLVPNRHRPVIERLVYVGEGELGDLGDVG